MTNNNLGFKINYDLTTSPKSNLFTDLTGGAGSLANYNTVFGTAASAVKGLLCMTNLATGVPYYKNAGYDTNVFTSPDTNGVTVTKSANLPLDTLGSVLCGTYQFKYKILLTVDTAVDSYLANRIILTGNVAAAYNKASYIQITSCSVGNAGTYTIVSATYDGGTGNTIILISETIIVGTPAAAKGNIIAEDVETYEYCLSVPSSVITKTANCSTSKITLTDGTALSVTLTPSGVLVAPTTTSRAWTVTPPTGAQFTNTTVSWLFGYGETDMSTGIYTGDYLIGLIDTCLYTLYSNGTTKWYVYLTNACTGTTSLHVDCQDCGCNVRQCIVNLHNLYETYMVNGNTTQGEETLEYCILLLNAWMDYMQAERCGVDKTPYCTKITSILATTDCDCTATTTTTPTLVVPSIYSGGYGSGAPAITLTDGVAGLPPSATDKQINIFQSTGGVYTEGDLYQYTTAGGWAFKFNIKGTAGSPGGAVATGTTIDTADKTPVSMPGGAGTHVLYTKAVDAVLLPVNGNKIKVKFLLNIPVSVVGGFTDRKNIEILWNSVTVFTHTVNYSKNAKSVTMEVEFTRYAVAEQRFECKIYESNDSGILATEPLCLPYQDLAEDLTTGFNIELIAKPTVGEAGGIVLNDVEIIIIK